MSRPTNYASRCLREFEEAVRAHEMRGAQHPEAQEEIEDRYQRTKTKLKKQLQQHTPDHGPSCGCHYCT